MVTTETQIANTALSLMGEGEIADIDGTDATATKLEEVYDQNRDFVLEAFPWPCAIKRLHLTLSGKTAVGGITNANPGVVTATAHPFSDGELVTFVDVDGMSNINGNIFKVKNKATDTFELYDVENEKVDTTLYGTYAAAADFVYRYATPDWDYMYDLPSDCLKPLKILDANFSENDIYTWIREGSFIYCNIEFAALKFIKKETTVTAYTSDLIEAIAYRLAWLTCIGITGSGTLRQWLETRYNDLIKRARGSGAAGGDSQDQGEALWVDAR